MNAENALQQRGSESLRFLDDLRLMLSAADPKGAFDATSIEDAIEIVSCRARLEILADVQSGVVPESVPSFAALHDYVDANMYGGANYTPNMPSETNDERYVNDSCRFWNAVQDGLDAWIKNRGIASDQVPTA